MEVRNDIQTKNNLGNLFQYVLSIGVLILLGISLIPTAYKEIYQMTILIVLIQFIVSIFRFRLLNVFFEVVLLIIAVIVAIPILLSDFKVISIILSIIFYFLKLIAIPIAILDLATFKNTVIYRVKIKSP